MEMKKAWRQTASGCFAFDWAATLQKANCCSIRLPSNLRQDHPRMRRFTCSYPWSLPVTSFDAPYQKKPKVTRKLHGWMCYRIVQQSFTSRDRDIFEPFTALHPSTCQTGCSTSLICRRETSRLETGRARRRVTVGDRSFAAAGSRLWNSLPADVQSAPSLATVCQKLKTHLFRQSLKLFLLKPL